MDYDTLFKEAKEIANNIEKIYEDVKRYSDKFIEAASKIGEELYAGVDKNSSFKVSRCDNGWAVFYKEDNQDALHISNWDIDLRQKFLRHVPILAEDLKVKLNNLKERLYE